MRFIVVRSPKLVQPTNVSDEEVAAFFDSLTVERETLAITRDRVLQSEALMVMKKGDRIIGLVGLNKLWKTPLVYVAISSAYQGLGYGYRLSRAGVEHVRDHYPFLFAIVFKQNRAAIRIDRKLGFKPCLFNYKYEFLFLPLRPWSYLLYPMYALFFPPWYWGYFTFKKYGSAALSAVAASAKLATARIRHLLNQAHKVKQ